MDTVLVVFYSWTGTSRRVAQLVASHHGWPLAEVVDEEPRSTWRCVLDSLLRRRPEVRYLGPPARDFRTVVLVSPVWMYRLAAPMRAFVTRQGPALQRVAVISTMGSGGAVNAVREISRILGRAPVAAIAATQREIDDGTGTARLLAFADTLQSGKRPAATAREPEPAPGTFSPTARG